MYDEITGQGRPAPRKRRMAFGRRAKTTTPARDDLLRIVSSGRLVDVYDTLDKPGTAMLAAEDAVWQMWRAEWQARRPRRWQLRAHRAWREEGAALEAKRERLVELTGTVRTVGRASS
jgi:hypothetical protein